MISEELERYYEEKKRLESIEHRDILLAIRDLINSKSGEVFFEYMFKNLEVGCLPTLGLEGNALFEQLGFLRAGNSIYKLACESSSEKTGQILAKIERKRYDDLYEEQRIKSGVTRYEDRQD